MDRINTSSHKNTSQKKLVCSKDNAVMIGGPLCIVGREEGESMNDILLVIEFGHCNNIAIVSI